MSFFANLLGGTLQGVGSGMSAMAADEERLATQRALIQERSQAALDLQRQRADDRLMQQEQMMQMRSELGGGAGGGGGGKGINLAALAMQAKTPEEQDRVVAATRTFYGDDAADRMTDKMFNRPRMVGSAATPGDFARYDRAGDMEAAPPTTTMERARYDADKGTQALQRAYTAFLDPAKLDDHAKAERQFGLNDFGAEVAGKTMRRGGSLEDAASGFSKYSAPKDETGREELAQQRIEATRERTAATGANSAANRSSQESRALDKQITAESKLLAEAGKKDKPAIEARITALQARRAALDDSGPSPAPSPRTVAAPAPLNPASRAAAWKQKFGAAQ